MKFPGYFHNFPKFPVFWKLVGNWEGFPNSIFLMSPVSCLTLVDHDIEYLGILMKTAWQLDSFLWLMTLCLLLRGQLWIWQEAHTNSRAFERYMIVTTLCTFPSNVHTACQSCHPVDHIQPPSSWNIPFSEAHPHCVTYPQMAQVHSGSMLKLKLAPKNPLFQQLIRELNPGP